MLAIVDSRSVGSTVTSAALVLGALVDEMAPTTTEAVVSTNGFNDALISVNVDLEVEVSYESVTTSTVT